MRCPFCGHEDSQVKDSRPTEDGAAIRRRRQCEACAARFTTFERIQLRELTVLKSEDKREPVERDKLVRSISVAARKRPVSAMQIEKLVSGIQRQLETLGDTEIPSQKIGEMVMERLRDLDEVAYIRFASVYREFMDLQQVKREIEQVLSSRRS